jgi:hypothetical protein
MMNIKKSCLRQKLGRTWMKFPNSPSDFLQHKPAKVATGFVLCSLVYSRDRAINLIG